MGRLDFALLISDTLKDWNIEADHSTLEGETHLIYSSFSISRCCPSGDGFARLDEVGGSSDPWILVEL